MLFFGRHSIEDGKSWFWLQSLGIVFGVGELNHGILCGLRSDYLGIFNDDLLSPFCRR